TDLGRGLEPRDEAAVLGDVVRRHTQPHGTFGQHLARLGVLDHRAVARGSGIAARAAVRLDDDVRDARGHSPDSGVRTRIAPQFSHVTTSSSAAALISDSWLRSSSSLHASHLRARSIAAPIPRWSRTRSYTLSSGSGN